MDRLIYLAMTGASHTMNRQAAAAQNLANADSTGYRAQDHRLRAVPILSTALPSRAFVVDASIKDVFTPGVITQTGRPLDLAVQNQGWIALAMPDGSEAYTRNGSLTTDANGLLQTRSGIPVASDGGTITIPPDSNVSIGRDGTISVLPTTGGRNVVNAIGRVKLVNPPEEQLVRGGDGLFRMQDGSAAPTDEAVRVAGGHLESSNVNVVEEMVNMISSARQFEMQMKLLTDAEQNDHAADQMLSAT
ncbi:MAG: flagellar basal body rod protein FlgF [Rhodocyclaceae bacterium]|nr:flagellar basal body rod protein FlgF [Rhodocyclaceae bacterium]MBX3670680.1 flagellar basal body rod protein FlgF [Rhodocyclaceae bacterium]